MPSEWENNSSLSAAKVSSPSGSSLSASSSTATSPEPSSNGNTNNNNDSAKNGHAKDCTLKASTMSHDPTSYVARARVTRPTPPKPSCNPMQFVQIKPCNLYQSAQQQLKKVEEIKKVKEVLKEEPEDWQNNLDNWKSSRRKRVEHIIERVVEVKKLELEEHDRTRRKSKTFSEMMEERGERGRTRTKLQSLASYNEDEANDLSDLGIGTSSASGKSSISEDCEVHSIVSEPPEVEQLSSFDIENNSCLPCQDNLNRISSSLGGYETSSTAPIASSPDSYPHEYTYEGAIEDYKSRVSKASAASSYKKSTEFDKKSLYSSNDIRNNDVELPMVTVKKEELPKIDISKKRELFENQEAAAKVSSTMQNQEQIEKKRIPSEFTNVRSIKDRLCSLEKKPIDSNATEESITSTAEILPGEVYSIKERLQCLKEHNSVNPKPNINKVVAAEVVAVPPLKDRLSSLQNAVTKEEIIKKPVVLVDEYQLELLKNEDMARRQLETSKDESLIVEKAPSDDSGINTTDEKIDQEPVTTDDEDDDGDITVAVKMTSTTPMPCSIDEKVSPSGATTSSNNEFPGEFDSSVSFLQLNDLNTPTVVSLVNKPVIVIDDQKDDDDVVVGVGGVVGGGDGGDGKILLNTSIVVDDKSKNNETCEVNHAQNLLKMFKLAFNEENDVDTVNDSVKSDEIEIEFDTLSPKILPKHPISKIDEKTVEKRINDPTEIYKNTSDNNEKLSSQNLNKVNEVEKTILFKKTPAATRFSCQPQTEIESNVVLNIDNSQNNSKNSSRFKGRVSSKIQELNKISSDSPKIPVLVSEKTQKHENPVSKMQQKVAPSSPILITNSTPPIDNSNESPPKFVSVSATIQQLNSLSSAVAPEVYPVSEISRKLKNSTKPENLKIQYEIVSSQPSTSNSITAGKKNPIYENTIMKQENPAVGLKKLPSPENNGRVEIFNSKNLPAKPKSPEVLPRLTKPDHLNIQSKDFDASALTDYVKDLETSFQPVIFNEKKAPNIDFTIPDVQVSADNKNSDVKIKPLETKPIPLPRNPMNIKSSQQPISPLPLDSCVDILQSFLEAEANHISKDKPSNQLKVQSSDGFIRQESIIEAPCSKIDVKDLPDPNFIRTPCIDINCDDGQTKGLVIAPSQSLAVRDSISSAGDSSPSSDVTVIFKPVPGSPTPNKSSLMDIANRMGSPIAARRDPLARQKTVCEKPCLKLDVKDLPDPNFIKTECFDIDAKACCSNSPLNTPSTSGLALQKTNADVLKETCEKLSTSPPLSPVLGGRNAEKPNFMIARVEVVETKIKVTTTNDSDVPPPVPTTAPPPVLPGSPKPKPKTIQTSKPKNIFEFLKKNFHSKPEPVVVQDDEFEPISVDNSKFYVPSDVISASASASNNDGRSISPSSSPQILNNNGVNIEITKKITSDAIVEQTDSDLNLTEEINDILDEEIAKLVVEDAKL